VPSSRGAEATPDRLEALARLVQDDSAKVRLEALRGLAKVKSARAAELALSVLDRPMDPTLDYGLWLTINDLADPWIVALESGAWKVEGRERQLAFALRALKPEQTARVLSSVLGDRPLARDGSGPWIDAIGAAGGPAQLGRLLVQASTEGFDAVVVPRVLRALVEAARVRQVLPGATPETLEPFLGHADPGVRAEAIRLAGLWKRDRFADLLLAAAAQGRVATPAERALVFEALRLQGGDRVRAGLAGLTDERIDPATRRVAALTLAALDAKKGFPRVVAEAATLGNEAEALEFWRAALAIKGGGPAIKEALGDRRLPEVAARGGMRVAREGGRDDVELVAALARAGGLGQASDQLTADLIREIAVRAGEKGEPHRGELVFRRADLACVTCHAIGGAGGKVGPDLTSIGASAPMDYLVEALLVPSAKIKEGYHSVVVETRDGEEFTGTLARETTEELFLRNAAGQEVGVPKAKIARRENGKLSLMPTGLMEPLPEQDRLDLFAFLSRLGKPGEFDASKGGVARRWRIANVVHTDQQNNEADWFWKRPLDDARWAAVYALVGGGLPRALFDEVNKAQAWTSKVAVVAATEVELPVAGPVVFRSGVPDAELWADGRLLGRGAEVRASLEAGRRRVVLVIDPRRIPENLRLEAEGAAFVLN